MDNELNNISQTQPEIAQPKRSFKELVKANFTHNFLALIGALVITGVVLYGHASYLAWSNFNEAKRIAEDGQKQIQELQQKRSEQKAQDSFANWQTYRNEEYGFEFKYPKKWVLSPENSQNKSVVNVSIMNPDFEPSELEGRQGERFFIYSSTLSDYLKLANMYEKKATSLKGYLDAYSTIDDAYSIKYKQIIFLGKTAYLVEVGGMDGGYDIVLENSSNVYTIELPGNANDSKDFGLSDLSDTSLQILSTFRFIPPTSSGQVELEIPKEAMLKTEMVFQITNVQMLSLDLRNYYKLRNRYPDSLQAFLDDHSYDLERIVIISGDKIRDYKYIVSPDYQHFVLYFNLTLPKDKIGSVNYRPIDTIKNDILGVSCSDQMIYCETD